MFSKYPDSLAFTLRFHLLTIIMKKQVSMTRTATITDHRPTHSNTNKITLPKRVCKNGNNSCFMNNTITPFTQNTGKH